MSGPITITLGLPHKMLNPNHTVGSRGGRMAKARRIKDARGEAYAEAVKLGARPGWTLAETRITFYVPDKRKRDSDNYLSSMKPSLDGLADAGIVANDHGFRHQPVRFEVDKLNPRVELIISPIQGESA